MKNIKNVMIFCSLISFLASCTIEKRQFMSGYYIQWNHSKKEIKENYDGRYEELSATFQDEKDCNVEINNENITASNDNQIHIVKEQITLKTSDDCDIILLKNLDEIKAKVIKIGQDEIEYKKCDNRTGPTYTIKKSEVFYIKYPNGTKEIINPNANTSSNNPVSQNTTKDNSASNSNSSSASNFEKGKTDAQLFHKKIFGHIVLGLFLGIIGLICAALSSPSPYKDSQCAMLSQNKNLFNDPDYLRGYKRQARTQNVIYTGIGWLIWLILLIAAATS